MSQRLTIAIPEELYERLQKVKQELNISGVCQEALKMAITLRELIIAPSDLEKLVERLRLERNALETQIKEKGYQVGLKSAQRLSYQEFQRIERVQRMGMNLDEDSFAHLCTRLKSHGYYDDAELIDEEFSSLLSVSEQNQVTFVKGWLEAVLSVWNTIKNQVNAEEFNNVAVRSEVLPQDGAK